MSKNKQLEDTFVWLDKLSAACESVILDTDVSLIEPFELINLINVRLHMEELKTDFRIKQPGMNPPKKKPDKNNLVLFTTANPKKDNDNDDTH